MSDFRKIAAQIDALTKEFLDKEAWTLVGEYAVGKIKARTRKGFGVSERGEKTQRLAGLKDNYKEQRKRLKQQGKLSGETSPNKSNLTKTGEMLDNFKVTPTENSVTISFNSPKLSARARYVSDKGRPFLNLSKQELWKVNKIIKDAIKAGIKKQGL
jgi:hypothetical protein